MRIIARTAAITALTVAALGVGACGSQDQPASHGAASRDAATTTTASAKQAPAFSAEDVAAHFKAVTGDTLDVDHNQPLWDRLSLSDHASIDDDLALSDRYGIFSVYVVQHGNTGSFTAPYGRAIEPDAHGIYWQQTSSGWSAVKIYGDVVLDWSTDTRAENAQFQRLDAVLSTLGRPAQAGRDALPASDRSCAAAGLTLSGTREGTCRDGNATLTIVNRDSTMKAAGYTVQIVGIEHGTYIKPQYAYDEPTYAKGEFIGVAVRVENTANATMDGLYDLKLRIGDKVYDQDDRNYYSVSVPDAFPLQPGDTTKDEILFDVPRDVAHDALTGGALIAPVREDEDVDSASELAAIRLRAVTRSAGATTATA